MKDLKFFLMQHPLLIDMSAEHVELIIGCASNVRFDTGQIIFREGQEANEFYLIRQGKIALEIGSPGHGHIGIHTLTEGDILGWSWLIPPYHWQFDARALDLTLAIALDGRCLRNKCESDHELGYQLLKRFSHIVTQRLESTRLQILDMIEHV